MARINPNDLDLEACQRLGMAVVKQAVLEYAAALRRLDKNPDDGIALDKVRSNENFFRGETYMLYCDIDGEKIIEIVRKRYKHIIRRTCV